MPTVEISHTDLCRLLGRSLSTHEVRDLLWGLKCEVESIEGDKLSLDVLADRPDLLSVEGIAREVKGILRIAKGLPNYGLTPGSVRVKVESPALEVRPYIACAAIRGVKLTDEALRQAMQLQEKLHMTYCRRRRSASIGFYNLDSVSREIIYTAQEPEKIRFRPLDKGNILTGSEILAQTEQGQEYGSIILDYPYYPLLADESGRVLSMPPIVNSEETKVTLDTRNLFIDVTGASERLVNQVLSILVSNVAERGGNIESVRVSSGHREVSTPDLKPKTHEMRVSYANTTLGLELTGREMAEHLGRMRYEVKNSTQPVLQVRAPAYRADILGETDLVEDLAIAYGYEAFKPSLPESYTVGSELNRSRTARLVREALIGLGFQEVLSFIMSNPRVQYDVMRMGSSPHVEVMNPMSQEYSTLRTSLTPNILKFLGENKHVSLPHRVFECGDVVLADESQETQVRAERRVVAAIADNEVGYEDIQAVLYALLREFGVDFKLEKSGHPSFLRGRVAQVSSGESLLGILGEINPEILANYELDTPVALFELDIDTLAKVLCQ